MVKVRQANSRFLLNNIHQWYYLLGNSAHVQIHIDFSISIFRKPVNVKKFLLLQLITSYAESHFSKATS